MSQSNGILTKSEILLGPKDCKKIEVEALDGAIWIRKLGDGELAEIEALQSEGGEYVSDRSGDDIAEMEAKDTSASGDNGRPRGRRRRGEIKLDLGKAIKNMRAAKHLALAFALSNDKNGDEWTQREVAQLPRDAVDEIAWKVVEHSDLEDDATFRGWREIERMAEEFLRESERKGADA